MSLNVVTLLYLVASVCFIQALKGLSNPKTARIGNTFGMAGMAIAMNTPSLRILTIRIHTGQVSSPLSPRTPAFPPSETFATTDRGR